MVGQRGTRPAHALRLGRLWTRLLWSAGFFTLAGVNLLLAEWMVFADPRVTHLFRLVALLLALMGLSVCALSERGPQSPR